VKNYAAGYQSPVPQSIISIAMTMPTSPQKLSVFLCHVDEDKPIVRDLYKRLKSEQGIEPWLDEEELLPGQIWEPAILEAMRNAHVIIVCLSNQSVVKEGYVQKQIKKAFDFSLEKDDDKIFIIPLRLDDCKIPRSLDHIQPIPWVSNSPVDSYPKLLRALNLRAGDLRSKAPDGPTMGTKDGENLYFFNKIVTEEVPYTFYIAKYPVTNVQYERFFNAPDFGDESFWTGFPKFNEDYIQIGQWGSEGWNWLQSKMKGLGHQPKPDYWDSNEFGIIKPNNPVVAITWYEANAYCNWLMKNWNKQDESHANPNLQPKQIRLPLELEWSTAAGGENPEDRYPWEIDGKVTKNDKEVARRANVNGNIGHTTPVNAYLRGASPYGVIDMAGNIWEWQANFYDKQHEGLALRGGSWKYYQYGARVARRYTYLPDDQLDDVGFRVVFTI
jgi:formylglycine-generating enzyme required for sulfatase activity